MSIEENINELKKEFEALYGGTNIRIVGDELHISIKIYGVLGFINRIPLAKINGVKNSLTPFPKAFIKEHFAVALEKTKIKYGFF